MINIFTYTDYRQYLADYYQEKKKENSAFSYKSLAIRAGFNNKGFVYNIVKGTKSLSIANIFKLSKALNHNRYEAEYFESLVAFNQVKDLTERNFYFEKLSKIRSRGNGPSSKAIKLRSDQYRFFANWWHPVVRSIIDMYDFSDDYKWLAQKVTPRITKLQAKHSVQLLEKLGLIKKMKNGVYKVTDKSITTGNEVASLAISNYHCDAADLAKLALQKKSSGERDITGLILGMSDETYIKLCEEIQEFQEKIMNIVNNDKKADRTYQFNFHLFPTSVAEGTKKK